MCLYSLSARFTQDGCDQRLQWHPLSPVRAPTKHSCGGCHWTDVCRPAQLLVAGACHSAHPRFISASVTPWKNNMLWLAGLPRCTQCLCSVMGLNPRCVSSHLILHVLLCEKAKKKKNSQNINGMTSVIYLPLAIRNTRQRSIWALLNSSYITNWGICLFSLIRSNHSPHQMI